MKTLEDSVTLLPIIHCLKMQFNDAIVGLVRSIIKRVQINALEDLLSSEGNYRLTI